MRKNLFLTLALMLASFAGINAQEWSVTLDASVGLPGETVVKDGVEVMHFQSGIIRTDKKIKSLRFTCAGNKNGEKPNGNNFVMALSELNVYTADMKKELNYVVKSNADYNTIMKAFDGQGLKALYDGRYDNYFHSMYAEKGAVAEYHYIEMIFEEEIDRFVIEWGGRPGNPKNSPTTVVLTEGGVSAEPFEDRYSAFGEEKITTLDALKNAEYFTIRGNAAELYDEYNKQTGEKTTKEPKEGSGPMYVTLGSTTDTIPSFDYLAQLVPVEGENTYYIYFPVQKQYLSGDAEQNQYDAYNNSNGWQYATSDIEKAAKITITPKDGDFEMSYNTVKNGTTVNVFIGAAPQSEGKMKTFEKSQKKDLEEKLYCTGYGIVCAFNWSFYPAEYVAPSWIKEYEISTIFVTAKKLANVVNDEEGILAGILESLESTLADIENLDEDGLAEAINTEKANLGDFIYGATDKECLDMETTWYQWGLNTSDEPMPGRYTQAAWDAYIQPGQTLFDEIYAAEDCYAYIEDIINYFAKKEENIAAFLASKLVAQSFPIEYTTEEEALGTKEGNAYVWQQDITLNNAVKGMRITFVETNVGNSANEGKYDGYPMVALGKLEIVCDGATLALTDALVTTNSQETSEGGMENLFDEDNATFWHSIWGSGTMNPKGYVYLDVKFPEDKSIDAFTIKMIGRNNASLSPKTIAIGEYGKEYVPATDNKYNVKIGDVVSNLSQLKDGGLYILQGNLNVNNDDADGDPRFYSGVKPYTYLQEAAENAPCVYMFKKAGDCWNILSLSNAKYLTTNEDSKLTLFESKAENVKIVDSQNMENTWVIYSEIDSTLTSNYKWVNSEDSTDFIQFDSTSVNVKARVYMDWDGGLAARPCYSPLPGVADPQFTALREELKVSSGCGDYLHFNKTNGEGEWTIYEASMNDEYYVYLEALVKEVNDLNMVTGKNPGCVVADEETSAAFDNAKAAANAAVNTENRNNAEKLANDLATALEKIGFERVGFDDNAVYRIESALEAFKTNTWYTRSIYAADNGKIEWTVTPESFIDENWHFLFRVIEVNDELVAENGSWRLKPVEEEADKDYIIQNVAKNKYINADFGCADRPAIKVIESLDVCVFNIKESKEANKANNGTWHANNHGNGNGYGSNMVYYNGGVNSASSWTFIYMGELGEDYELGVEDVVENGNEIVSVSYYTPAGVAIAEPVKGINIVVTVYANGVVEATKVLVK